MSKIEIKNKIFSVSDTNIGWWNVVSKGMWEPFTFNIIDKFIDENSICIDLGAWYGFISLYLAQTASKVYCIEPDPVAYLELSRSINLTETREKIYSFNQAISNFDGVIELGNDNLLGDSMTRVNQQKNVFKIDCTTLSTFCKNNNINKVDFIKIDIEGSEEFVFQDTTYFTKYRPTILIQLHYGWFAHRSIGYENFKNISKLYNHIYDQDLNPIKIITEEVTTCVLSQKFI